MKIVRTVAEMRSLAGDDFGLVPTMGAFHEGHLALMRAARASHAQVCASLFVNPLQFGRNEDLSKYPRNEERDARLAEQEGVDVLFVPSVEEVYPRKSTIVHVPELTDALEGLSRPGHFDGVATVVAKLFNIVRPRGAYFGWKDLQQCLVIRRMVEDLQIPVTLHFIETVREDDGLALSSRNSYLSPGERRIAPFLYQTLVGLAESVRRNPASIDMSLTSARNALCEKGFEVDYLELVSLQSLSPVREKEDAALVAAVKLGTTRLIDNLRIATQRV